MASTSSSERPTFEQLSASNYMDWSGEMKAWLMNMGTWGIVSGKEKRPNEKEHAKDAAAWDKASYKAAGELFLCVSKKQWVHFRGYEEDPIQVWKRLEAAHLQKKPGAQFNATG
ncbi:hypothetical protein L208DRAFT_1318233 [Tricholoma matsutake]|nr:hypothetical protein L208DRAFT_1318233 [Tricholoma matsutake 945]